MTAETLLPPLVIGGLTSLGVAVDTITQATSVPLSMVAGIFCFVTPLVWWLSRKLTSIETDIRELRTNIQSRPCQKDHNCPIGPVR